MKNIELLSPAGKIESAYAAIQNGADAIYMSGYKFGARAYAANFSMEEIEHIINYAHGYHVRVYITLNTLLYEHELEECFAYIKELYELKVDALIVQDLGIMYYIRTQFPDFEVHASTQMHVYNKDALLFLESQGIKRAVLARECSKEQISSFRDIDIEKEVFVHGALCISFSGQCLFSAMNNNRSGNRGMCAQGCRLPYTLLREDKEIIKSKYLLSPKDINLLDDVETLKQLPIDSLKIEGRMKSSEYVGEVTSLYRSLLDNHSNKVSQEEMNKLKVLFNRDYTKGHLFSKQAKELMNYERPNHIGIELGSVIYVNKQRIGIKLIQPLHQHDGIRFLMKEDIGFQINRMYKDDLLVASAKAGEVIEIDTRDMPVSKGTKVVKTKDVQIEKEIQQEYQKQPRKESIYGRAILKLNEEIQLEVWDDYENFVNVNSEQIVSEATNRAALSEDIKSKLMKTGDTIYQFKQLDIQLDDGLFIPIKVLNELRRTALDLLYKQVQKQFQRDGEPLSLSPLRFHESRETRLEVTVLKEEQLIAAIKYPGIHIYIDDSSIYKKYAQYECVHYRTPNVIESYPEETSMAGDIGGINKGYHLDYSLNVHNSYALEYLQHLNNKHIYLSQELNQEQTKELISEYQTRNHTFGDIGVVLYGKVKLMSMKYCAVNSLCSDGKKKNCQLCKLKDYYLQDTFQKKFWLRGDENCIMHMYHHKVNDQITKLKEYKQLQIDLFRLDFTDETPQEVRNIIQKFQNNNQ